MWWKAGTESVVVKKALRDHHRVYRNESAEAVLALDEAKVTDFEQYMPHVAGSLAQEAYRTGDHRRGMLDYGPAAVFADRREPMAAIFDRLVDNAAWSLDRLAALREAASGRQAQTTGVQE